MVRALALAFFVWPARAGVIVWEDGSGGRHEHGAAVSYEAFCEGLLEAVERGTRPLTLVETPVFAEAWAEARRKRLRPRGRAYTSMRLFEYLMRHETPPQDGLWLEFGVFRGDSIRIAAEARAAGALVYGFDTFEGLPTAWAEGHQSMDKGAFSLQGRLPSGLPRNVRLIQGLFEDTLPGFLNAHGERASYINIDNDLYAGAKFVLDALGPRLAEGAILNFHELVNIVGENVRSSKGAVIPPARECLQETRAIYDFLVGQPNLRLELIPRRILHGQAIAFRVVAQRRHEAE